MGFDAAGYDEMEFARIASRHFKTMPLEYYVTPDDVLSTLPEIAAAFPEPFGNSSAAAVYHCARIAREHGIDLLLAGDGGDELFGGNERYAKQLVFERYSRVPRPVRSALLEPLVNAAGRVTRAFPIGKAVSYIEQANVPLPDRLQTYNFLHRHGPSEVFAHEFLEQMDASRPLRLLRDEYGLPDTRDAVNRMLFVDWKFTLHDNDLVKVNAMCQLAGVEVAYPMLDQSIVDFSLRLPASWKVRNGQLRWFYKRAMRDFLPRQIVTKTKHGFGLPFGVWTRTHEGLRRLSEDALGSLAERGYFRPKFLREALRLHRDGHASYYGELVWILMVLELWLQAHSRASSGR
jgi:asparagine synthase (glutamine-hydrolysing)